MIVDHPDYNDDIRSRNDLNNQLSYPRRTVDGTIVSTVHGGGDYIQRNAMVLIELIQNINAQLQTNNSTEQIIIVGPSMGGQISRYALRYMETHGMNHNCKLWVSFDSPHQGALLPIGLQIMAKELSAISTEAKKSLDVQINCPAAKEMLVHHHTSEQLLPTGAIENGVHFKDLYYQELDNLGWPQNCRKIAMISGADNGSSVQPGSGGAHAVSVSGKISGLLRFLIFALFPPSGFIDTQLIGADCYLAPNQQQQTGGVFEGHIFFKKLTTQYAQAPTYSVQSVDLVPSGFYPGFAELKESADKGWKKKFFRFFVTQQITAFLDIHAHEFVYSTLALGKGPYPNPNRKWDDDISNINVTCGLEKESPFDAYWGPSVNTRHDSLLYGHVTRLWDEFHGTHMNEKKAIVQTISNNSTDSWCNTVRRTFQILNPKAGQTFNWSTSNASLVIRNGQGTSSVEIEYTGGYVTAQDYISCQSTSPCYDITESNFSMQSVHFGAYSSSSYSINGPSQSWCGYTHYFSTDDLSGATNYNWFWPYNWYYISGQGTRFLTVQTPSYGSYLSGMVGVIVTNNCGSGGSPAMKWVQITCGGWRVSVSPNPTSGDIVISTSQNQKDAIRDNNQIKFFQIKIIDQLGNIKKHFNYPMGITNISISTSNLAAGVYIIQAYDGKTWETTKFVKQ